MAALEIILLTALLAFLVLILIRMDRVYTAKQSAEDNTKLNNRKDSQP